MINRMGHGGYRSGAGRKAKDSAGPLYHLNVSVRLTDFGALNRLGDGNLSLGLRRLIELGNQHGLIPPIERPIDPTDGG